MNKAGTKKVVATIINVVVWVFLIFAIIVTAFTLISAANKDGIPSVGGKGIINIVSNSMSPTFKKGDIIIATTVSGDEAKDLKVGDVVTYKTLIDGKDALNSHRIIEVKEVNGTKQYVTQGDNREMCPGADAPIPYTEAVAVWHDGDKAIGGVGSFISFMRTQLGFFLVIILPLILFFLYELINFILTLTKLKAQKAAAGTAPVIDEEEIKRRAIEEYLRQQEAAKVAQQPTKAKLTTEEAPSEEACVEDASADETTAPEETAKDACETESTSADDKTN